MAINISFRQHGFTLIEIMIAVVIIAILTSIAIPAYNNYIHTARLTEGADSIATLQLAQTEFFQENGFFFTGADTATVINNSLGMWTPTPWDPTLPQAQNIANLNFTYTVNNCALAGGGNGAVDGAGNPTQCYTITATGTNQLTAADVITVSN